MAALLTVLAIAAGVGLGIAKGGSLDRLRTFRPDLWQALVGGVALQLLIRVTGVRGTPAVLLEIVSAVALLTFAVANIRIGGMVLVVAGLGLNLLPTVVDWGIPTSRSALDTAGLIDDRPGATVILEGPRHVATADDALRWLGEIIPLPTRQVISIGDVIRHAGYVLVVASLLRGRVMRRPMDGDYGRRIAPLAEGPARRRGPGLHPSRLDHGRAAPRGGDRR